MSQKQSFPKPLFLLTTNAGTMGSMRSGNRKVTGSSGVTAGVCCEPTGPFKEFLQNADDAQARRFAVCVGKCHFSSVSCNCVHFPVYAGCFVNTSRSSRANAFPSPLMC
jgi:hypothetical protein